MATVTLARLEVLRRSLQIATTTIRDLDAQGVMVELARRNPGRWDAVIDALSTTMDAGQMGSIVGLLDALDSVLAAEPPPLACPARAVDAAPVSTAPTTAGAGHPTQRSS